VVSRSCVAAVVNGSCEHGGHSDTRSLLQTGDSCELGARRQGLHKVCVPEEWRPELGEVLGDSHLWTVTMLHGPQSTPDYFTPDDIKVCQ
jgi:hypothetical protein